MTPVSAGPGAPFKVCLIGAEIDKKNIALVEPVDDLSPSTAENETLVERQLKGFAYSVTMTDALACTCILSTE